MADAGSDVIGSDASRSDMGGMQSLQFLVVGVLKAQGLPGYQRVISTTRRGLYAYVREYVDQWIFRSD